MSRTEDDAPDLELSPEADTPDAPAWPPAAYELELRKPVEFKGETFEVLSLREPTGQEWEQIFEHPAKSRRRFAVSTIAGLPMGACALIGIGDLVRAENYLNAFFEAGQATRGW